MTDSKSTRSLFQQMDRDHSGTLDFTEFSTEFIRMNPSATITDMRELFDGADLDHNGLLDYREVRHLIECLRPSSLLLADKILFSLSS